MVSYTKWISILFEVHPDAESTEVVSVGADLWSQNKEALKAATVAEARAFAKEC